MMSRSCSPTRAADAGLRRVMFTAAGILLLVLLCAAPAAASAADAVVFGGGTFDTAEKLETAINAVKAETVSVSGNTLTLLTDLNLTDTITITGKMTILGAGHTIWRGGKDFHLITVTGSSGNLTLGSDETSKLTVDGQGTPFTGKKGLIAVTSGGNLTMNSGVNLTNNTIGTITTLIQRESGGVSVASGGTFTMVGRNHLR